MADADAQAVILEPAIDRMGIGAPHAFPPRRAADHAVGEEIRPDAGAGREQDQSARRLLVIGVQGRAEAGCPAGRDLCVGPAEIGHQPVHVELAVGVEGRVDAGPGADVAAHDLVDAQPPPVPAEIQARIEGIAAEIDRPGSATRVRAEQTVQPRCGVGRDGRAMSIRRADAQIGGQRQRPEPAAMLQPGIAGVK